MARGRMVKPHLTVGFHYQRSPKDLQTASSPGRQQDVDAGWAIIENASARTEGCRATLVSGNPVTFASSSTTSTLARETVPVEVRLAGDAAARRRLGRQRSEVYGDGGEAGAADRAGSMPKLAPAPAAVAARAGRRRLRGIGDAVRTWQHRCGPARNRRPPSPHAAERVSAGSGQSLAVPIIDREVPADRISPLQSAGSVTNPLALIRLDQRHRVPAARHRDVVRHPGGTHHPCRRRG